MSITPVSTPEFEFPLGIYECVKLALMDDNNLEQFSLYAGLDHNMVADVRKCSLDAKDIELSKTSDRERFGTGEYTKWYSKDRVPFALYHDPTQELAGLVWCGEKELPHPDRAPHVTKPWVTIAYRTYPNFRGRHLLIPFLLFALAEYRAQLPCHFWAATTAANEASKVVAQRCGLVLDPLQSTEARLVFVESVY